MTQRTKLILSEALLAHLKAERAVAKTPRTRAALDGMIRAQEVIVRARRLALASLPSQ